MIFKEVADLTIGSSTDIACTLLGYYNPGDGGGGELYWDPTSAQTADNGTIFQVGTNSGRWIRVYQSKLFPEYFGAIGDGSTDDHDAFTTMFGISGHCVLMPNKTYLLSGNYSVDSKTLFLDGYGATLLADDDCEGVFITVTSTNDFQNHATASYLFRNLNIIGPEDLETHPTPVTKSGTVGLYFYGIGTELDDSKLIDNKLITSVSIKRFDVGIDIFSNVWCLSVDKCSIVNCCVAVNADKTKTSAKTETNPKGYGTNYGENIRFNSCNISNNQLAIMNNGLDDLSFEGTSIDYNDCMVQVSEGRTKFINCYIERGNDQADVDYWIKMLGDANWIKLFFDNCEFVFAKSDNPDHPEYNHIKDYEIVYVETHHSIQPGSVVIQRSKINIFNYERSHFMFSPTLNSKGGGIMQGNFYLPGYNVDHTRDFIPSVYQNSLRAIDTNDDNYSGWTFYTKDNTNEQAKWLDNELILSPNLDEHKRFAYYDVNVYEEEQTVSLRFFYQLQSTSNPKKKIIVRLQALDEAGNIINPENGNIDGDLQTLFLDDTMSNPAKTSDDIPRDSRRWKWGKSSKRYVMNKYLLEYVDDNPIYCSIPCSKTEGSEAYWGKHIIKNYSALPRGTKSIRLLFEGTDNLGDICKIKNIELCLE